MLLLINLSLVSIHLKRMKKWISKQNFQQNGIYFRIMWVFKKPSKKPYLITNYKTTNFLKKDFKELYNILDLILKSFDDYISIEPYNILNLLAADEVSNGQLINYEWPEQIFYYINEELANLNRVLLKKKSNNEASNEDQSYFASNLKILKCCLILSK